MSTIKKITVQTTLSQERKKEIFVTEGKTQTVAINSVLSSDLTPEQREFLWEHFESEIAQDDCTIDLDFYWIVGYSTSTGNEHFFIKTAEQMKDAQSQINHAMLAFDEARPHGIQPLT